MNSVAWSPSGTKVATGTNDGTLRTLRLVDAATGPRHASVAVVQEYGCWALRNLTANNVENQVTIADYLSL